MHFDDKPLQQNSRGEYIAFVERAGRCPNGLRYFSAWSNKFDRTEREREREVWILSAFEIIVQYPWASGADQSADWSIVTRRCDVDLTKGRNLRPRFRFWWKLSNSLWRIANWSTRLITRETTCETDPVTLLCDDRCEIANLFEQRAIFRRFYRRFWFYPDTIVIVH